MEPPSFSLHNHIPAAFSCAKIIFPTQSWRRLPHLHLYKNISTWAVLLFRMYSSTYLMVSLRNFFLLVCFLKN